MSLPPESALLQTHHRDFDRDGVLELLSCKPSRLQNARHRALDPGL